MTQQPFDKTHLDEMPLMAHFAELRTRLIYMVGCVIVVFLALVGFSRELYDLISSPLVALLPKQASIIATNVASGFLAPIRLTFLWHYLLVYLL